MRKVISSGQAQATPVVEAVAHIPTGMAANPMTIGMEKTVPFGKRPPNGTMFHVAARIRLCARQPEKVIRAPSEC